MRYIPLNIEHRQVRSSKVCVNRFIDMPWSTCSRPDQKKKKMIFLRKRLTIVFVFDGLWLVGKRFPH